MKQQFHYFLTAVLFFTRIPCPKWVNHSSEALLKSNRFFPLIGIVVGSIAASIFYAASFIFPKEIAIILSMISSIWITGALHEDGFADVCDGFGGGWTKDKILSIMKDSVLGAFGVIGLIIILGLKFYCLNFFDSKTLPLIIISAHAISRYNTTLLLFSHSYVRDEATSKVKINNNKLSLTSLIIAFVIGITPLFIFKSPIILLSLIPLFITYLYLSNYYKKWIGGYTGDCAGALQQVSEIVFYLSLIGLWKLF